MLRTFVIILFIIICDIASAQNLVLNPSFEEYNICPSNSANVKNCKYVFDPQCISEPIPCYSSSDYFNTCVPSGNNMNVPLNFTGYQYPKTGYGYVGSAFIDTSGYREYFQVKLSQPLEVNRDYNFSFFVNLSNLSHLTTYAIGVKFVDDSVYYFNQYLWEFMEADWINDENNYITDTVGWTMLNGTYQAKGDEKWMIVGVFHPEKIVPSKIINPNASLAWYNSGYFYYDAFFVEAAPISIPNVFTPNGDGINDFWIVNGSVKKVTIYNRWGNIVFISDDSFHGWNGNNKNNQPCSDGVYYYNVIEENRITKEQKIHKGFITLLR